MHRILERQIGKLESKELLKSVDMHSLLNAISETYTHYDEDRALIERSLDLSSKELSGINQALREERDRAKAIVESVREGLVVVDKNRIVVSLNPAAEQLLGIDSSESIGKKTESLCEILHNKRQLEPSERPVYLTLEKGRAVSLSLDDNIYIKTIKGKVFPVAVSTVPLQSGNEVSGAVVVFRDITNEREATAIIEKKVVERTQEVKERRAELLASINAIDLGFVLADEKMAVMMTNPAAVKILKVHQLDSLNMFDELFGQDLQLSDACHKCIETQRSAEFKNVSYKNQFLHFYLSPIVVAQQSTGVAIIIEDITEAKIIERSKDEFFSIASHELRTPLTAIRGNTALIQQYYQDEIHNPIINKLVKDVHESSIQLIGIVNDFLDVSRLEQGRMIFKKEKVDLSQLITTVILDLKATAEAKGLELTSRSTDLPHVHVIADSDRLRQVLINLLGNGIKYTDTGTITVDIKQNADTVITRIADTGKGLNPQGQLLLFRKFQQAGESLYTRDTTKSTGLGLYISKQLMEGMGGSIKLEESVPGKGSTFSFTLPTVNVTP